MASKNYRASRTMKFKKGNLSESIKTRLGSFKAKQGISDARQKIQLKKRKSVVDAREILANMARKQDARKKLQKIRQKNRGENVSNSSNVRSIGSSILKKTDRNGKISLQTKTKATSDLNLAIQHQLGLISPARSSSKKLPKRAPISVMAKAPTLPFVPPVIRKTILNDYSPPQSFPPYQFDQSNLYRWYRPGPSSLLAAELGPRRPQMKMCRNLSESSCGDWGTYASPNIRPRAYIDLDAVEEDEEMPLVSTPRPIMSSRSNVHSRLDSSPGQIQTHGILSGTKTKVVMPAGHRIVVSNLQNGVTEDDIRELFEDIGQLLVARLVRPGTAEVIYKNLKDAQKAVDTYHNRQLDGQPMKCLLVNKRPLNNPTAPALSANADGILSAAIRKSTTSNKLVPDLSTIHKVLFQRN